MHRDIAKSKAQDDATKKGRKPEDCLCIEFCGERHFRHREDHSFEAKEMAQKSTSNLKNEYPLFVRAQDGSEFSLHWDVDTDPDSLLDSAVK